MDEESIVLEIRKRRYFYAVSLVLVIVAAFVLQVKVTNKFKSEARFIVNEGDALSLNVPNEFRTDVNSVSTTAMNRMYIFLHSSECVDTMIREFRLYEHYGIDPDRQFAYERLFLKFTSHVFLDPVTRLSNIMKLSVLDHDRVLAADMANRMVERLNEMNEEYLKSQLRRKIFLYNKLYVDIRREMESQKEDLDTVITNYRGLVRELERHGVDVGEMKATLDELVGGFMDREKEMLKVRQLYTLITNAMETENFQSITLTNKALPDIRSRLWTSIGISLAIGFAYLAVALVVTWIYFENRVLLRLLWTGRSAS